MLSTTAKTEVLIEALPYIRRYEGTTFVVKYGGAAMIDEELQQTFAQDIMLLSSIGIRMVVVHGGGKEITATADKLGLTSRFVEGQRYTDRPMMDVVQMVLAGKTNKDVVRCINAHGAKAVGISGIDAQLLLVSPLTEGPDLGLVGEVARVNSGFLTMLLGNGFIPVIAPVGVSADGETRNVNADIAAAAIAGALKAEKLVYLSDVEGVKAGGKLIESMDEAEAEKLITAGIINNGMIPKIRSAFDAMEAGVRKVHMIDGRIKHSLLLEIFTDAGIGTELVPRWTTLVSRITSQETMA